jgi:hypothetical protein
VYVAAFSEADAMTIYRHPHRPIVDPIAADHDIGQRIAAFEFEMATHERDLDKLRRRFVKTNERLKQLRAGRDRLITERLDGIEEVRDVEILRTRGAVNRGMGR